MGLFSSTTRFDSFEDLLIEQLQDLYDAENRLTKAIPKMADAAASPELRALLLAHLRETQEQVYRLERVFSALGKVVVQGKTCEAMRGLIAEGDEVINATGDPDVKDAALITAAQRVEHYEIAAYGCARTFAQQLGQPEAARLLQETLDEEAAADKKLTALAEQTINVRAAHV